MKNEENQTQCWRELKRWHLFKFECKFVLWVLLSDKNVEFKILRAREMDLRVREIRVAPWDDLAALNADGDDYTDEELATYLKIRRNMERLEVE